MSKNITSYTLCLFFKSSKAISVSLIKIKLNKNNKNQDFSDVFNGCSLVKK